jgi:hypothetical protein
VVRTSPAATTGIPVLPASFISQVKDYFGGLAIRAWHQKLAEAETAMLAGAMPATPWPAPQPRARATTRRPTARARTTATAPAPAAAAPTRRTGARSNGPADGINQTTLDRVYAAIPDGGMIDRDNIKVPGRMRSATLLAAIEQLSQQGRVSVDGQFVQRAQEMRRTGT